MREFFVEYRLRPVRNLERCEGMVQLGRETTFSGYIIDWNSETRMWVVDVRSFLLLKFFPS